MKPRRLELAAALAGLLPLLAACQPNRNERLAIGDRPLTLGMDAEAALSPTATPSAPTLDRSHWLIEPVRVERDLVQHWPTRTRLWPVAVSRGTAAPRELGNYPTPASALRTDGSGAGGELFAGPASVVVDAIMWIPRMIDQPPGAIATSPREGERAQRWPVTVPDQAADAQPSAGPAPAPETDPGNQAP